MCNSRLIPYVLQDFSSSMGSNKDLTNAFSTTHTTVVPDQVQQMWTSMIKLAELQVQAHSSCLQCVLMRSQIRSTRWRSRNYSKSSGFAWELVQNDARTFCIRQLFLHCLLPVVNNIPTPHIRQWRSLRKNFIGTSVA